MRTIDVYHCNQRVGTLQVVDHIRLPLSDSVQSIMDLTLTSRGFLYKPCAGDLKLEERDGTLVAAVKDRLGPGDVALIVGFSSDHPSYQPDPEMDAFVKDAVPGFTSQGIDLASMMMGFSDFFRR